MGGEGFATRVVVTSLNTRTNADVASIHVFC